MTVELLAGLSAFHLGAVFVDAPAVARAGMALLGEVVSIFIALWVESAWVDTSRAGLRLAFSLH